MLSHVNTGPKNISEWWVSDWVGLVEGRGKYIHGICPHNEKLGNML